MELFIKDGKTFTTKSHCLILDYEIKPSIYDTISTYTVPNKNLPNENDFIYDENSGFIGIVSGIETDREKAVLSIRQIHTMFSRKMIYQQSSYTYLEDYLKELIDNNYTLCPDSWYQTPYLTVNVGTQTAATMKPDVEQGVFTISSYMAKLRRLKGIYCTFSAGTSDLTIDINIRTKYAKKVDFTNPSFYITEQNFSQKMLSKITTYCLETSDTQNWVLLDDGRVVNTTPNKGRVDGEWTAFTVTEAADVQDTVNDVFAKNYFSHNVTFQCPMTYKFDLYDNLLIKLEDKIFTSYVAQTRLWKGSKVQEIQCGELQVKYPYLDLI